MKTKPKSRVAIMHYYAITYPCGVASDSRGNRHGTYHVFSSRGNRDAWVANGNPYRTGADYREALPAGDPAIRAKLRKCLTYGDIWRDIVTPDQREADAAQ